MKNTLCLIFAVIGLSLSGQNVVPDLASDFFTKQMLLFPQEKIHVQTDKPYYVSGEKIWFSAYVVDATEHIPVTESRYVYVELIDPLDSVFVRQKIRHDSISYSGYISIPEEAPEGVYELRAYTRFMESLDEEYFFSKPLSIYYPRSRNFSLDSRIEHNEKNKVSAFFNFKYSNNDETIIPGNVKVIYKGKSFNLVLDDDGSSGISVTCSAEERERFLLVEAVLDKYLFRKYIHIPADDKGLDISFYPEGGSLLDGAPIQVAFKAMKSDGQSADVTGKVYDDLGNEIMTIKTRHNGMGSFILSGEAERRYHVMAGINDEKPERFDLPAVLKSGYGLSAKWIKDKLCVSVLNTKDNIDKNELYLIAHTRGVMQYGNIWDNSREYILFEKEKFPSGVLHLVLTDSEMNPVSERLVFVNNDDQAYVDYIPDRHVYGTRKLVENIVRLKDNEGNPLQGSFSVSVTDEKEVCPDSTSSILTNLLLTSDLRGRIENPSYYFHQGFVHENSLDLLMMTQGWRRYNVSGLLRGAFSYPSSYIEAGSTITGTVQRDFTGRPDAGTDILAVSLSGDYFENAVTDDKGRFLLEQSEQPDSSIILVSLTSKSSMNRSVLTIDRESYPSRTTLPPFVKEEVFDNDLMGAYVEKSEQKYTNENGMRIIYLGEVTVTSTANVARRVGYYSTPDKRITEEEINESLNRKLIDHLIMTGAVHCEIDEETGQKIIVIRDPAKIATFVQEAYSMKGNMRDPLLLIDGIPASFNYLYGMTLHDVTQIDILKGSSAGGFGPIGYYGVISIYMRRGPMIYVANSSYIKKVDNLGYQKRVEFYAPRYDTEEAIKNRMPDFRTTIHWQPSIQTDSDGTAYFNFYTADAETSYSVIIEGMTSDGRIIRKEGQIEKIAGNYVASDSHRNENFFEKPVTANINTTSNITPSPDKQKENSDLTGLFKNEKLYFKSENRVRQQVPDDKTMDNHQYLDTDTFRTGTLSFDGNVYNNVPMRMNLYSEAFDILSPEHDSIVVPREYLDYAIIDSKYIVYQKQQSVGGKVMPEGYYIRVYDGQSQVWKHIDSSIKTKIRRVERTLDYYFDHKEQLFVYTNGVYHFANNENALLNIFDSKKKELKKVIKDLGLSFDKSPENIVVTITKCYDELSK